MSYTKQIHITEQPARHIGFGHKDRLGREIGCVVRCANVEFAPQDEGVSWGYGVAPGEYIQVRVQATRNGNDYGSSQPRKYFTGEVAAAAYINKRVEASLKAAAKKAGK